MSGMSRNKVAALAVAALVALATWFLQGQGISVGDDDPRPRETPTATVSATPTYTASPTYTATPTHTASPTESYATGTDPDSGLPWVAVESLPDEAHETLQLIDDGGPYPYDRDGVVFENREGILPDESTGYYHEYTVVTPGEDDRGARRIVTGSSGEYYWTRDHYDSFERIDR